jgi:hypothetical protein
MHGQPDELAAAGGRATMRRDEHTGGRDDPQRRLAETREHRHPRARLGGRDAVAVALEGDQSARRDDPLDPQLGRVSDRRQRQQRLGGCPLRDRQALAAALVSDLDTRAIE